MLRLTMFSEGDFQVVLALLILLCFLFMASRRLGRATPNCKNTVPLPRLEENNLLFYLRWNKPFLRGGRQHQALLQMISSLALRFKERGLVHLSFPFFDVVYLFHPNTIKPLLQSPSNVDKPLFYYFSEEWLEPSILVSDRITWRKRRKLLTPAFHMKILESYIPVFEKQSKILAGKLDGDGKCGTIDVLPLISDCVMSITCETGMGIDGARSSCDVFNLGKHMAILLSIVNNRMSRIFLWPDVIFRFTEDGRQYRRSQKIVKEIANQIIHERISQARNSEQEELSEGVQGTKLPVLLDTCLPSYSSDSSLTLDDFRMDLQVYLSASHDTSTTALVCSLYLLGKHPDVQKKMQKEVDEVLGDDPDRLLTKEDLCKLKYTECVIKETLRLYSIIPIVAREISEEISIGEYKIPKGFICIISIMDIHRDPDIFPCPDKFDPERFLPENCLNRHPYAFIPFSGGPRNCIGQKFAMMAMKVILARVIQKFAVESLQKTMEMEYCIMLRPSGPVWLQVTRR